MSVTCPKFADLDVFQQSHSNEPQTAVDVTNGSLDKTNLWYCES